MFIPSRKLTKLILRASPSFTAEILLRSSVREPNNPATVDLDQAQQVLAEQVVGAIGMVSRHRATTAPAPAITLVAATGFLDPEFEQHLQRFPRLTASQSHYETIKRILARDLFDWVEQGREDVEYLGLSADTAKQCVTLACRTLKPVLTPLSQEE